MKTLKLEGFILTREQVTELAQENPDVTEVDLTDAKVYSASAMHELVLRFPNATMTGVEGYNKETYEWVLNALDRRKGDSE